MRPWTSAKREDRFQHGAKRQVEMYDCIIEDSRADALLLRPLRALSAIAVYFEIVCLDEDPALGSTVASRAPVARDACSIRVSSLHYGIGFGLLLDFAFGSIRVA